MQIRMFEEDDFRDERAYYEEVTLNDVKESESASLFESSKCRHWRYHWKIN